MLSKTEQTDLYKKASAWHKAKDEMDESVRYALASGDADFAANVIERALKQNTTWAGGNLAE